MNRDFPIKDIGMERDFWAKIKGGGFKNVKKLKKMMQKVVQFAMCFQNRTKFQFRRRKTENLG